MGKRNRHIAPRVVAIHFPDSDRHFQFRTIGENGMGSHQNERFSKRFVNRGHMRE